MSMKSLKFHREQVVELFTEIFRERASDVMAEVGIIELVRAGTISAGKGAEVLGLTRWAFEDLLARHNVPSLELSSEELTEQLRPLTDAERGVESA
jgi:predicted HTH domain antitoxin